MPNTYDTVIRWFFDNELENLQEVCSRGSFDEYTLPDWICYFTKQQDFNLLAACFGLLLEDDLELHLSIATLFACKEGCVDVLKWLSDPEHPWDLKAALLKVESSEIDDCFKEAAVLGHTEALNWLKSYINSID